MSKFRNDFAEVALEINQEPLGMKGLVCALVGTVFMFPGLYIAETQDMDNSLKPGNEIAIQEYADAIDILEGFDQNAEKYYTPSGLGDILSLEDKQRQRTDQTGIVAEHFETLNHKFGESVILDQRLNEQQKYDLVHEFEKRVGDFEDLTGLYEPDYADLDEARAIVIGQKDDHETAQDIISTTGEVLRADLIFKTAGVGASIALLALLAFAGGRRRLEGWASDRPYKKPPKFRH